MEHKNGMRIIRDLQLSPHPEGGFFRRIYSSPLKLESGQEERLAMSSILYLLTEEHPKGHLHRNRSDIVHYFMQGSAIEYILFDEESLGLSRVWLGPDLASGQVPWLVVPGGVWKASRLPSGEPYGLVAEAVSPGFEIEDMSLATSEWLGSHFPEVENELAEFILE
jgi:predicted cupin superfamily sugar epimerase